MNAPYDVIPSTTGDTLRLLMNERLAAMMYFVDPKTSVCNVAVRDIAVYLNTADAHGAMDDARRQVRQNTQLRDIAAEFLPGINERV
jgi:pyruvate kinase